MPAVRFREPYSYDTFYAAAHAYSEELLTPAVVVHSASKTLDRIIRQISGTEPTLESFKVRLASLIAQSGELQETTRSAFWPARGLEIRNGEEMTDAAFAKDAAFNHERWFPYDQAAWVRFTALVAAEIAPALNVARDGLHTLHIPPESELLKPHLVHLNTFLVLAFEQIARLETVLNDNRHA